MVGSDVEVIADQSSGDENVGSALRSRFSVSNDSPITLIEWQKKLGESMKERRTFTDLGTLLLEGLMWLDTPLGRFVRQHSHHAQPPPVTETAHPRKGDLLPIHPSCISVGSHGITDQNIDWV